MPKQPQGTWYLWAIQGPSPGQIYAITHDRVTIGRRSTNDIVLRDPSVSREHARLRYQDEHLTIEDLDSANGVTVNGARISGPQVLSIGDQVMLSNKVTLVLEWSTASIQDIAARPPSNVQATSRAASSPSPISSRWSTLLPLASCGLATLVLIVIGTVAVLILTDVLPNPFSPQPAPTELIATATITATPTPSPSTTHTHTPYPTYTLYPTYTSIPTATSTPTTRPTNTVVPVYTPTATHTSIAPTYTPTMTPRPPTATPTAALPLSLDWRLESSKCISKTRWTARFRLVVSGGTGEYIYYRDIEKIHGPTADQTFLYELPYGADAAAVGTFIVTSGDERAEDSFYVKHPDCSDYP